MFQKNNKNEIKWCLQIPLKCTNLSGSNTNKTKNIKTQIKHNIYIIHQPKSNTTK
jgi:hypothetical protein